MKTEINIDTLDTFTRAYITAALWSSCGAPYSECPDCGKTTVLCRWNDEREYVCVDCSQRDPNFEPALDENFEPSDISQDCLAQMVADCADFQESFSDLLAEYYECFGASDAGHDFWLTRNRHGAGFWDRQTTPRSDVFQKLTDMSHPYGECNLYTGDDGQIHGQ